MAEGRTQALDRGRVPEEGTQKITMKVTGMTCAACASKIERKLSKMEGVSEAAVNLATEKATVEYSPGAIRVSDLRKAIEDLGYGAKAAEERANPDAEKEVREREIRTRMRLFGFSAILTVPLVLNMFLEPFGVHTGILMNPYFQFTVGTIIQAGAGWPFYRGAYLNLKHRSANMDVLIALGTSAAYLLSVYNTFFARGGHLYYEAAAVILTLIILGKMLEAIAKGRTSEAIKKLMGLQAKTARVIRNGAEEDIPIEEVEVGDLILVRPGEKVPVDGIIKEGYSSLGRIDAHRRVDPG